MKTILFAVYDAKAETFSAPYTIPKVELALRAFGEMVQDEETDIGKYPEDYQLLMLGEYDTDSGMIEPERMPVVVINALELKNKLREAFAARQRQLDNIPTPEDTYATIAEGKSNGPA